MKREAGRTPLRPFVERVVVEAAVNGGFETSKAELIERYHRTMKRVWTSKPVSLAARGDFTEESCS